jgi:catechol 2,3-dioxygenase-like lactoylglutathione lyase family enzyme
MVKLQGIYESVLYAGDLKQAKHFYSKVLGLELLMTLELMLAFQCGSGVLLIFDPVQARQPNRGVPSHGAEGPGHLAFAVQEDQLPRWKSRLEKAGVAIEQEMDWEDGGYSLYFRDPAGNSLELATPVLW